MDSEFNYIKEEIINGKPEYRYLTLAGTWSFRFTNRLECEQYFEDHKAECLNDYDALEDAYYDGDDDDDIPF